MRRKRGEIQAKWPKHVQKWRLMGTEPGTDGTKLPITRLERSRFESGGRCAWS